MPLTRHIYPTIDAIACGPITKLCPDVTATATNGDTTVQGADVDVLMLISDGDTHAFILGGDLRQQLVAALTGIQIALPGDINGSLGKLGL